MPITSQQAKRFSNENARVLANQLLKTYRTSLQFLDNVVRDFENLAQVQSAQNEDVIEDGGEQAGRPVVTKLNVAQLKFVVEQFKSAMETDDRLDLTNAWAHDTTPLY